MVKKLSALFLLSLVAVSALAEEVENHPAGKNWNYEHEVVVECEKW